MQLFTTPPPTQPGPADWFSGTVFVDAVVTPDSKTGLRVARVTFTPGARTAWHTHPNGQAIHILSGVCQAQARDGDHLGELQELHAGQSAWFAPGEVHWHGAHPGHAMVHLAMQAPDAAGNVATWLDQVNKVDLPSS